MPDLKGSPALSLSWDDGWKILKGALVAAAGAALTYLAEWVSGADFGEYTPVVVSLSAVLVNIARKWLLNTQALALFLAFVLPLGACQGACRHLPRHPIPDRYPPHGSVIVSTVATTKGNWREVRERMMPQFGGFSWHSVTVCNPDDDELSHLPEPEALCLTHRAVATFDRKWCNYRIEDVELVVPVLFDRHTGSKLP